jgi:hypothetical protein
MLVIALRRRTALDRPGTAFDTDLEAQATGVALATRRRRIGAG